MRKELEDKLNEHIKDGNVEIYSKTDMKVNGATVQYEDRAVPWISIGSMVFPETMLEPLILALVKLSENFDE